ncbi:HAMP domain-containing sensor histidine kinase [Carboxylicivirga sp. M1479]|uniref:sensor histidine kinase n=1 Tax=Carboxylicivirga sp. M1479 TaxID=2594476 RepID=UPI001178CAD2|nr:HAMP domain-containing sensor histidine kinase [Carboxylicivirga sp. M1479]TRX72603.1 HAMP domain-containing histidine kinase [Carboxylicivirga sp. M1479]
MSFYTHKRIWKLFLLIGAITIGFFTLVYTDDLTNELKEEERKSVEIWIQAIKQITQSGTGEDELGLTLEIISQNTTIPIIIVEADSSINSHRNIDLPQKEQDAALQKELQRLMEKTEPLIIDLGENEIQYLYYDDSILIKKLGWFPIVQLSIVALFIIIAYIAFNGARKAEQDQVWVGMSKETAHQLGTPTSSLLGWVDLLKLKEGNEDITTELEKDVERLQVITDRFSKIGSKPELKEQPLILTINEIVDYLSRRTASNINISVDAGDVPYLMVNINKVLFQWVIENICKNAVDAIGGEGSIIIKIHRNNGHVHIDIKDTGKGLNRNQFATVFKPGYTTKLRGWGLGLSLAKRIVQGYHGGKLFVKESEIGKGTTFRITLPKA